MNNKKDYTNIFLCITLGSIVLIFSYYTLTRYKSLIDIAEIQYIIDSKSNLSIGIKDSYVFYEIKNLDLRVKVYRMLNRVKLRKDIFLKKPELKKPVYYINFSSKKDDEIEYKYDICILENGMIEINNELFYSSENLYDIINYMVSQDIKN